LLRVHAARRQGKENLHGHAGFCQPGWRGAPFVGGLGRVCRVCVACERGIVCVCVCLSCTLHVLFFVVAWEPYTLNVVIGCFVCLCAACVSVACVPNCLPRSDEPRLPCRAETGKWRSSASGCRVVHVFFFCGCTRALHVCAMLSTVSPDAIVRLSCAFWWFCCALSFRLLGHGGDWESGTGALS
jgi:hypothetical protein